MLEGLSTSITLRDQKAQKALMLDTGSCACLSLLQVHLEVHSPVHARDVVEPLIKV